MAHNFFGFNIENLPLVLLHVADTGKKTRSVALNILEMHFKQLCLKNVTFHGFQKDFPFII